MNKTMGESILISIVIPAYNEEQNISRTLSEVSEYLGGKDFTYEVIVIDDGSRDSTIQKAREFEDRLDNFILIESTPNRGKGYVLKKAVLQANGEYIVFMDADSSVSVRDLDRFLPLLESGFDIYIGSRRIPGAKVSMPLKREVLGRIYILLAKILLAIRVNDINCGFKLFKRDAAKNVFSKQIMDDWSFDAEILHIAHKDGYKVKEVPVEWVYKATSKVSPLRDGIRSFLSLVHIRNADSRGTYD